VSQPPEYPGKRRLERIAKRSTAGGAYEGAFEAVGSILIATLLGYWFDEHYGTTPSGVLVGAGIGFGAFVLRLFRLGKQLHPDGPETTEANVDPAADAAEKAPNGVEHEGDGQDNEMATGVGLGLSDLLDDDESDRS
jgi:F0F1-type ATP synthase assembly protein I